MRGPCCGQPRGLVGRASGGGRGRRRRTHKVPPPTLVGTRGRTRVAPVQAQSSSDQSSTDQLSHPTGGITIVQFSLVQSVYRAGHTSPVQPSSASLLVDSHQLSSDSLPGRPHRFSSIQFSQFTGGLTPVQFGQFTGRATPVQFSSVQFSQFTGGLTSSVQFSSVSLLVGSHQFSSVQSVYWWAHTCSVESISLTS